MCEHDNAFPMAIVFIQTPILREKWRLAKAKSSFSVNGIDNSVSF